MFPRVVNGRFSITSYDHRGFKITSYATVRLAMVTMFRYRKRKILGLYLPCGKDVDKIPLPTRWNWEVISSILMNPTAAVRR